MKGYSFLLPLAGGILLSLSAFSQIRWSIHAGPQWTMLMSDILELDPRIILTAHYQFGLRSTQSPHCFFTRSLVISWESKNNDSQNSTSVTTSRLRWVRAYNPCPDGRVIHFWGINVVRAGLEESRHG
jgi:hypothetical protein